MPTDYIHSPCAAQWNVPIDHAVMDAVLPADGGPPDPDRWGNRRVRLRCRWCGESESVTVPKYGKPLTPLTVTVRRDR